jgi:plasmid stabilization system protein ParE
MKVKFHPDARVEVREARKWYYERSPLSAIAFAHAVENAISRIAVTPTQYQLAEHRTHKLVLQRFPFSIFYLTLESGIVIVAVAHQKRRPGYWSSRVTTS